MFQVVLWEKLLLDVSHKVVQTTNENWKGNLSTANKEATLPAAAETKEPSLQRQCPELPEQNHHRTRTAQWHQRQVQVKRCLQRWVLGDMKSIWMRDVSCCLDSPASFAGHSWNRMEIIFQQLLESYYFTKCCLKKPYLLVPYRAE